MTAFYYHPTCLEHTTGPGHPERPARLTAILEKLQQSGTLQQLQQFEPQASPKETLALVHPLPYIELIETAASNGPSRLDSDTTASERSFEAARLAAGAAVAAVENVASGEVRNAFCAMRPPGHHAEVEQAMGFCLFNNVAIAAEHLVRSRLAERVLIIDWDVHHGNGTQHIFYERGDIFYLSLHQWPLYPGTGRADETGHGAGAGTTRNVLLAPDTAEQDYFDQFQRAVEETFQQFRPDFVLLSAGFDAHHRDPLASLNLSESGFASMTDFTLDCADQFSSGKLVSLLEGGYDLEALAASVEAHVKCLLRRSS